jgi:hypothetical protein
MENQLFYLYEYCFSLQQKNRHYLPLFVVQLWVKEIPDLKMDTGFAGGI